MDDKKNRLQLLEKIFFYVTILFLPTQLGKHFWPPFSFVEGIRIDYLSPTIYLTDVLLLLLFVTYASSRLVSHNVKISNFQFPIIIKKYWILVVLVFIGSIGIYFSLSPIAGLYKLIKIIEMVFLGLYIAHNVSLKRDVPTLCVLFSIGILFESLLAMIQFLHQSSIGNIFWFFGERTFSGQTPGIANASINGQLLLRPYGTFPHPNVLAGYLIIVLTMIISNFQFPISNFKRSLFVSTILIGSVALLLTLSRVVIVLWLLVLSSWFMVGVFKRKSLIINQKSLIILLVTVVAVILLTPLFSRFTSILDVDKETVTRRHELNVAAIEMFKKSPILGIGLNNFLVNRPQYQKPTAGPLWLQPVHNIFLLIAAETGIVGLLFFLWFVAKTIIRIKNQKFIIYHLSFIIFFELIFLGMFDHYFLTIQQGQLLFALVFGIIWADENRRKQT